jgi:WD40 repeat protein
LQHERWVSTVRFSPDGRFVVTASGDNTAKVFRVPSGELVHTLKGHDDYVRTAEFDARGLRILTSSYDGTARVYSAEDGRLITALSADKGQKLEFAKFSPDGRHAVGATNVGKGYLWCTDASGCSAGAERREFGQIVWKLWTHNGAISGVEFSSDGKRLATASHDRTARVWDVASGLETRILRGHGDRVNSIAFSLDDTGDRLLTTSADRSVRIWDTATGIEVERLQGHTEPVLIGVVLRGGMVVTAGRDRTARLWRQVPRDRITAMSAGVGAHGQATVPTDADVLTRGQMMATRCFSVAERRNLRLKSAVPPDWCIERRKWPFDDEKFRSWLKDRDKPFPDLE